MFKNAGKRRTEENILESVLFGVGDELRKRVLDAHCLLPVRKRILESYVHFVEGADHISPRFASLGNYFRSHNMHGDKVKKESAESLDAFTGYDFVSNKSFRTAGKSQKKDNIVLSMTHGIDDPELVAKVREYSGVAT